MNTNGKSVKSLSSADREFLSKVYNSARLNPFSIERLSSDAAAAGSVGSGLYFPHITDLIGKLDNRLRVILGEPCSTWRDFPSDDAVLIIAGILFLVFHRHSKALDDYILAQSEKSGPPLTAECGASIFADLKSRGFSTALAERYVGIFFQLRRAFFFISGGLIGESESMRKLRIELWNAVFTSNLQLYLETLWDRMDDFSILLLGETGTGKGAAAMAIGRSNYIPFNSIRSTFSENFTDAFLSINLSEFSESLIESELFGHVKGAFTGAVGDHAGIFSRCSSHGAIFLDEIGDVSERIQIKLLQVLQQRIFSPVGGHGSIRFGGRILAATNQNLHRNIVERTFRKDFYYRLSSSCISLPPLRERIAQNSGELSLLLGEIVRRLAGAKKPALAARVEQQLLRDIPSDYSWPGNVRELEQAARSIIVTGHYKAISSPIESRNLDQNAVHSDPMLARAINADLTLDELSDWYCKTALAKYGSYSDAAKHIGIDWRTLKSRISPHLH